MKAILTKLLTLALIVGITVPLVSCGGGDTEDSDGAPPTEESAPAGEGDNMESDEGESDEGESDEGESDEGDEGDD